MKSLAGQGLERHYGAVRAIDGVDIALGREEIVGLVGPNGSGKTTLLNLLSGLAVPTAGSVQVDGRDITGGGASDFARAGVARTFQTVRLFNRFTTWENLEVAARATRSRSADPLVAELIERFGLTDVAGRAVGELPYGTRRRVSVARCAASEPSFVLLDEPAAGMNEAESLDLGRLIRLVHETGTRPGVVVVDHDMALMVRLCDRLVVLAEGKVIAAGSPGAVMEDPLVIDHLLGEQSETPETPVGHDRGRAWSL